MKKEERIKKKLTSKQVGIISMVIAMIGGMIFFYLTYSKGEGIFISGIISLVMAMVIAIWCYSFVLKGTEREINEEEKALQADVKKFLCTGTITELLFTPKNNGDETEMILGILKEVGCRFFAKLDENENIILIVYDKDGKKVWEEKIENYFYFKDRFKVKK